MTDPQNTSGGEQQPAAVPDAPTVDGSTAPPMPAAPPVTAPDVALAPAAPAVPGKPGRLRTLTTLLIGAAVGAAIVGGTWYTTSRDDTDNATASTATENAATINDNADDTFTLNGNFTLNEDAVDDGIGGCEGSGGYTDITLGTSVTVYDAAGSVIATGMLALSKFDEAAGSCTWDVSVYDVPGDQDFYQVEIGHRGKLQLSVVDAKADGFSASLGD